LTKIGRKGFMLAEVVVVAIVIATVLVTLFTGVNNVASAYEVRNRYYDVDSMYAAIEVNEILKRNNVLAASVEATKKLNSSVTAELENYKSFYSSTTGSNLHTYITTYSTDGIDELLEIVETDTNATFTEYGDYLKNHLDFSDERYNYMIVVERREDDNIDDCYYYALKLKY